MRFGFIGLGNMGMPMARSLLNAGIDVTVHNRSRDKVSRLEEEGATSARSPADLAEQCDVVFTCLGFPGDVERVYFGDDGLWNSARKGQVFVDTSTVTPAMSRAIAERLSTRGVSFLDAPISGGIERARTGDLTFMVGGEKVAFDLAGPGFAAMGSSVFHLGGSGSGTAMKLVNQLLVAVGEALAVEGLIFGVKAGLDPRAIYDVIRTSHGYSPAFERMTTDYILKRNFEPSATLNLIIKDLDCVSEAASELGVRTLLAAIARQNFIEAKGMGHGERDLASVVFPAELLAGVQVGPA